MTRYLCWLAVLGVIAVPDWASACRPGRVGRVYVPAPVFFAPVAPSYPAPARCGPPVLVPCPPPVLVCPSTDMPAPTTPRPLPPPKVDPPPGPAVPSAAPSVSVDPPTLPKFPPVDIPKDLSPLPKLEVPKEPDFRPVPPAGKKDGTTGSKEPAALGSPPGSPPPASPPPASPPPASPPPGSSPPGSLPGSPRPLDTASPLPPLPPPTADTPAVPTAAPPPPPPEALVPSPTPPLLPGDRRPEALPALTLPPDYPLVPSSAVSPTGDSTSRSSPLTAAPAGAKREPVVDVFLAGPTTNARDGYKSVGFYNHTGQDLSLTIEGRRVRLPAKNYLQARLGSSFTWGYGDRAVTRVTIPESSPGLDVVFRE
jgi:hypothetical protein